MVQPTLAYVDGQCQSNTHTQKVIIPKPKYTTLTKQLTNTQTIFRKNLLHVLLRVVLIFPCGMYWYLRWMQILLGCWSHSNWFM